MTLELPHRETRTYSCDYSSYTHRKNTNSGYNQAATSDHICYVGVFWRTFHANMYQTSNMAFSLFNCPNKAGELTPVFKNGPVNWRTAAMSWRGLEDGRVNSVQSFERN